MNKIEKFRMTQTITNMARFHQPGSEDYALLLNEKDAINTKKATKVAVKCFRDFLAECSDLTADFEALSVEDLNKALKSFYVGARKTSGELFKKSALQNIRYGIKRFLKEKRNIDIVKDSEFNESNEIFKAVSTDLKRKGLGGIDHHPPISEKDLQKLYSVDTPVFDTNTPYGLQRKVWFEITLYLCRRGRENLRSMTKDTFKIARDDVGRQYVYQSIDELDKNHRADAAGSVTDGRMYELPGNKNCPVFSFQKYLSKLNPNKNDLWQRPRDSFDPDEDVWYVNASVGKNSLASFMSDISNVGKLSKIYRNHSVRATSITVLDVAGISGRHIMKVSGHKSETSLKSYSHFISDGKKREISETLSAALGHQLTTQENVIPETVTENLSDLASVFAEDFELDPLDDVQSNVELSNVLLEIDQRKPVSQNQLDVSSSRPRWFRLNFSGNCRVQININYHK